MRLLSGLFQFLGDNVAFFVMIFIGWENFVTSIDGPRTSTPMISLFLFRSRIRLSEIGSLSATFPFFSRM